MLCAYVFVLAGLRSEVCEERNYLLKDRMTSLDTFPFLVLELLSEACLENTRSGSIDMGDVCAQEVWKSFKGTKKKI